ncbi:protein of unknown function [Taphrina deformans PYCC 5710]|uniref:Methyltransferase domain-containing protein n=1 Tax=Taphrina deformans (strain PYCC 5710 / ATCC 11124 / CBS 356.35 / IMI 108563 / JCM 9778 / NBRC 8474) TaxID=1097556 RepID=R4XEZ8_TAPDE|nr:protein of unknown function [Taphrina deformans PYCC 5710]|eukprot:CCG84208.1 protein of unknown function [Taphrina deformans PYCC 5710]
MSRPENRQHMYAGNLSHSMRENYSFGVDKYYEAVQATYRNPSFGAVRIMLWNALTDFYEKEHLEPTEGVQPAPLKVLDLAAGAGEATTVLFEWFEACQKNQGNRRLSVCKIPSETPRPTVFASDPFTEPAFRQCHPDIEFLPLSFAQCDQIPHSGFGLTICSFALHLVPTNSELWSCLDVLSRKSQWLLIISPHKKPEIKNHIWGWSRWNTKTWTQDENDTYEIVQERVRGRLYRSNNFGIEY